MFTIANITHLIPKPVLRYNCELPNGQWQKLSDIKKQRFFEKIDYFKKRCNFAVGMHNCTFLIQCDDIQRNRESIKCFNAKVSGHKYYRASTIG